MITMEESGVRSQESGVRREEEERGGVISVISYQLSVISTSA
ncbi:hypothetical protein [Okeania sp. SIO2B3]|nr:hypothetical protein [Okeania sp. SIO2B3]